MASLTEVASMSRKIIKFGGLGLAVFLILRIVLTLGVAYWKKLHPPPPPPPTVEFGKLEKIKFPTQEQKEIKFNLQLPTLDFPTDFPDRAKVYLIPRQQPNFTAWDKAKAQALALGFSGEYEKISTEVYRWTKRNPATTTFTLNIFDGSFSYEYAWQEDPNILATKNLPAENQAVQEVLNFLSKVKGEEIIPLKEETKVIYLKVEGNKLKPAMSFSEADLVQVNLYRPNIDEFPVVTVNPAQGSVTALISGVASQRVLKLDYNYFPVNNSLFATYPIKTPQQAWQDLQMGKGYLAFLKEGTNEVIVRRVKLGYYDSLTPQPYLQPIYIFTGDNDFIGYVPAVTDNWLEDSPK